MLGKLKQLLQSSGAKGPVPSGLCLWRDLDEMERLAKRVAEQAVLVTDWPAWRTAAPTGENDA